MFFAEPTSAFRNIARALRPGARLVMMVWQDHDRNEWALSIDDALAAEQAPLPVPTAMDPFSSATRPRSPRSSTQPDSSSCRSSTFTSPCTTGRDVAAALEWVGGFTEVGTTLQRLDPVATERALDRLARTIEARSRRRHLVRFAGMDRHRESSLTVNLQSSRSNMTLARSADRVAAASW